MATTTVTAPAAAAATSFKAPKRLPAPNSDAYEFAETLSEEELEVLRGVRTFMENRVAPIINKYWIEDSFPFELIPVLRELNIG